MLIDGEMHIGTNYEKEVRLSISLSFSVIKWILYYHQWPGIMAHYLRELTILKILVSGTQDPYPTEAHKRL